MMFNNCGNMGLPIAALAFGPVGLSAMVALFTVSNLLHFTLGLTSVLLTLGDQHGRGKAKGPKSPSDGAPSV